ncbi:MFS transporter [Lichenicola cladoniae]|uniref:MFS transporter n=1 Tax=Lichenicola cladoniae TaxID=1484109 RepID=A0A6M8HM03_9PROT|nr:MFS transporter [Lichenicola cladoniae]NPD69942.1 MFS transporter [Acetobacteraceae bacterium]QKE89362.1 MFS transporter [Lichenicola cladoniae]
MNGVAGGGGTIPPRDPETLTALCLRRLLPLLVVAYVVSFVDRTNIALAKSHLQTDLGISAAAYGLGAGLFFLTYALTEVPSNMVMHRVGARRWITRIMVSWGVISGLMAVVQGPTSFYVLRMLLGVAEAGLFPGVMLYLTYWFGAEHRARASGLFLLGVCLANVISGPLGGALLEMNGVLGLRGWQWLFILEAVPALVVAAVIWRRLPDRPRDAPWLTAEEAAGIERRISRQQLEAAPSHEGLGRALLGPQSLLTIGVYFCHQIAIYTVTFFLPGIIGGWGHLSPLSIGSLTALPWLASTAGAVFALRGRRTPLQARRVLVAGLLIMASGMLVASERQPALALLGFCISASMFFVVQALIFTYPASRLSGPRLAIGLAFTNSCGLLGGFTGPTIMGRIEQQTGSATGGLIAMTILLVVAAGLASRLRPVST